MCWLLMIFLADTNQGLKIFDILTNIFLCSITCPLVDFLGLLTTAYYYEIYEIFAIRRFGHITKKSAVKLTQKIK